MTQGSKDQTLHLGSFSIHCYDVHILFHMYALTVFQGGLHLPITSFWFSPQFQSQSTRVCTSSLVSFSASSFSLSLSLSLSLSCMHFALCLHPSVVTCIPQLLHFCVLVLCIVVTSFHCVLSSSCFHCDLTALFQE